MELHDLTATDFDADDQEADLFTVGKKVKIELADMDHLTWKRDLEEDLKRQCAKYTRECAVHAQLQKRGAADTPG